MSIDQAVQVFSGFMILVSLVLAYYVSNWWVLLTIVVALNLIQSAFTGFCPAATVFKRLGLKPGPVFR